jgi:hypothetical protein
VDQHGDVEITRGEHFLRCGKVYADLVAGRCIGGVVGEDFDGATGFVQAEMMGGGVVGKTHGVIAAGLDFVLVLCDGACSAAVALGASGD